MKKITITALLASALVLAPALADDEAKKKNPKPAPVAQVQKPEKKVEKKAAKKVEKKCLDEEIQNLESSLDKIGQAIGQRMETQSQELAKSQAELAKAKAECDTLRKKLAASEANSKKVAQEFVTFRNTAQKKQQATMANLAKVSEASKGNDQLIAQLKEKNAATEAHCKAACERLKAIVGNLKKVEEELAAAKK